MRGGLANTTNIPVVMKPHLLHYDCTLVELSLLETTGVGNGVCNQQISVYNIQVGLPRAYTAIICSQLKTAHTERQNETAYRQTECTS